MYRELLTEGEFLLEGLHGESDRLGANRRLLPPFVANLLWRIAPKSAAAAGRTGEERGLEEKKEDSRRRRRANGKLVVGSWAGLPGSG